MNTGDLGDMDLPAAFNMLRQGVSYDTLSNAVDGRVSSQTLQRFGDPNRPYPTPVRVESLVAAADAINTATPQRTTWWAMWCAHGRSFERLLNLPGRPRSAEGGPLVYLPPGWATLSGDRFAAWNRIGAALVCEQAVESAGGENAELRSENAALRKELADLRLKAAADGRAR